MKPKMTVESSPTSSVLKPKGLFEAVGEELRLRSFATEQVGE